MAVKKSIKEWMAYFNNESRQYTQDEFNSMMLFHIREYLRITLDHDNDQRASIAHIEGMMARLDAVVNRRMQESLPEPR
jgi:hypothetical protein